MEELSLSKTPITSSNSIDMAAGTMSLEIIIMKMARQEKLPPQANHILIPIEMKNHSILNRINFKNSSGNQVMFPMIKMIIWRETRKS